MVICEYIKILLLKLSQPGKGTSLIWQKWGTVQLTLLFFSFLSEMFVRISSFLYLASLSSKKDTLFIDAVLHRRDFFPLFWSFLGREGNQMPMILKVMRALGLQKHLQKKREAHFCVVPQNVSFL